MAAEVFASSREDPNSFVVKALSELGGVRVVVAIEALGIEYEVEWSRDIVCCSRARR